MDEVTAAALREAFDGRAATCLRWAGNAEASRAATFVRVYQNDYVSTPFIAAELQAEEQVPEFVWDAAGEFAWGTHLYPDSLVIACEWEIFRALHTDPRLDTITVRADRDVLPGSSGD